MIVHKYDKEKCFKVEQTFEKLNPFNESNKF